MSGEPIVFISYSVKDQSLATAMHAFLNASGIKALKAPEDIALGTDWAAAITSMIESCSHMVLVWTSHSMASQEVSKELTLAMQCGAVIIPFRSENLAPEGAWRYHLSHVQWLEAHRMPEGQALEALARQVGSGSASGSAASPPRPRPRSDRSTMDTGDVVIPDLTPTTRYDAEAVRREKLKVGLLTLFLGTLGMHKFYLGRVVPGLGYLVVWVLMGIVASQGGQADEPPNTADITVALLFIFVWSMSLAEAVTYFSRGVEEFWRLNLVGKRPWF